jgi:hypothetical protein
LAQRLDRATRAFIELRRQIEGGKTPGMIGKTIEKIEGLLVLAVLAWISTARK